MMRKIKKILTLLMATLCMTGTAATLSSCQSVRNFFKDAFSNQQKEEATLEFKDNFPANLTLNVNVDVSQYVKYEKGTSLTLKAEYTDASGAKKQYETFGMSFMPTQLGDVTLTVGIKNTNITISKTVVVKIPAPKVISSQTVIRYRGEAVTLDSLKEGLSVLALNDEYTFKALQATLLGTTEKIDLSGLETYTFTQAGTYEVKYEISNDGGSTKGSLYVLSKRAVTENEKDDLSNYGEGIIGESSGRVVVDEEDKAENSDWSYTVWANSNATGSDVYNYSPSYWTNFGMLELENGIDLSRYYLEFDVKFSKDSRDLFSIRMVDAAVTMTSNEKVVNREGEADENGEYAWQHVSMKDMFKHGTYRYIRFMIMHPFTSEVAQYDANNVWVKIDNVKLCEYDEPYEYHEPVNYEKQDTDYVAAEGEFEESVQLWENFDNSSIPTYLAQSGMYTDELTEYNFTVNKADVGDYRFILGARVGTAGSYENGVYVDFRRDSESAFFAVYAPVGLNQDHYLTAGHCSFISGHNYTATYGVIGNTLRMIIHDNTSNQTILDYEYVLEGVTLPANGGFGFWTYKDMLVACKKPHVYTESVDEEEVTISELSIGVYNTATGFDVAIGNGMLQKAILSETNNLAMGEGTFGKGATWNERPFWGQVGVIAFTRTSFRFFPTGNPAPQVGDKLTVPAGSTMIVGEYTVIFGEEFVAYYNGETWQAEYVEPAPVVPTEQTISALTYSACNAEYKTIDFTSVNGATEYKWASTKAEYNGSEIEVSIVWETTEKLQVGTGRNWAEGDVFTLKAGSSFVQANVTYTFEKDYSVYYYDGTWNVEEKIIVDEEEVTISELSIGEHNTATGFDVVIGNGMLQKAILSEDYNLAMGEGTFGKGATWNERPFWGQVGVIAFTRTSFRFFPTGNPAPQEGDKLTVPAGSTMIVGEYTVIFGEEFVAYYNGETWQTEYVAAPPTVTGSETVTVDRGEEIVLNDLKAALTLMNPNEEYIFEVLQATLVGGEEVSDLSGLETYTFTKVGTYEVTYRVSNNSGSVEGTLLVVTRRVITANEENDLSNYDAGIIGQSSAKVVIDEEDKAENSDWSYAIHAASDAVDGADNFWLNHGLLKLEGGIDLSRYYLEFDLKISKDARDLIAIRMIDEAQTTASAEKVVRRTGEVDANGDYVWQHVSMKDMYKYGAYQYIRFMVMHPLAAEVAQYNASNVWVKIDNVKLCEYDEPYEYHEAVNYIKTDADYVAAEGEFEESVQLWENLDNGSIPSYLAQSGAYTDELTELNFTVNNAEADGYHFVLGARLATADDYKSGVWLDFKCDSVSAFFALYAGDSYLTAAHCYFVSGHNNTAKFGVIGDTFKLSIYDNTAGKFILEYQYKISTEIPENGGFGIWTYKNLEVGCKKPYVYVEPAEPTEVTISALTYSACNAEYKTIDFTSVNGATEYKWASTKAEYNGSEIEVSIVWETTEKLQVGTGRNWAEGDVFTLKAGSSFVQANVTYTFEKDYSVYYYDGTWNVEEKIIVDEEEVTISELSIGEHNTATGFDVVIGNGMLQKAILSETNNLAMGEGTFGKGATWNERPFWGQVGVIAFTRTSFRFFPTGNPAPQVGDKLTVPAGSTMIVGEYTVIFGEEFVAYYNGETWQTEYVEIDVTVSNLSIGQFNTATGFDVSIGNGAIPAGLISDTRNLAMIDGTFGTQSTWNERAFWGQVGVIALASKAFRFFPTGTPAPVAGDKLTVPAGVTAVVDNYTIIFNSSFEAWFNGETWQMTEYVVVPDEPEETNNTLSNFSFGGTNDSGFIELEAGSGEIPESFQEIAEVVLAEGTFGQVATINDVPFVDCASVMVASSTGLWIFLNNEAVLGDVLVIPKGATIVYGDYTVVFGETFQATFDGTAWQKEVVEEADPNQITISAFSFGGTNASDFIELEAGSGEIPESFQEIEDAVLAEGTFGQVATINDVPFVDCASVMVASTTGIWIFLNNEAVAGDVIVIPEGATIIYGDYTVVFGETFQATFDGEAWQI